MTKPDDDETRREALEHWHLFCQRILPRVVRRIGSWKQLPRPAQTDLAEELQQELAADCLANAPQVVVQPPRVRHGRWLRLAERYAYRHYVIPHRRRTDTEDVAARPEPCLVPELRPPMPLVMLANGRANVRGSATRAGFNERSARLALDQLAERLGADDQYRAFWRMRLAEALTGLAADLLRDREDVHLLPRERMRPDPDGRLRRLRRLLTRFHIRPATQHERRILGRLLRPRSFDRGAPRRLLESAVTLAPFDRATWLWLFEACLADGDLRAAVTALRRCRQQAAPTILASTLARARLLEARSQHARATGVVVRGARRFPHDVRLGVIAARLASGDTAA